MRVSCQRRSGTLKGGRTGCGPVERARQILQNYMRYAKVAPAIMNVAGSLFKKIAS